MSLTDHDILELTELCNAVVDQTASDAQQARLSAMLEHSKEARRFYVQMMALSASLGSYAAEMQSEAPDVRTEIEQPVTRSLKFTRWTVALLATAAALVIAAGVLMQFVASPETVNVQDEIVAHLTGTNDCIWVGEALDVQPGEQLRRGERLQLTSGSAEITFACGATITITGPADLELNSAWDATLHHGALRANVPPQAIGFRIANPTVEVVDLGTEFSVVTDEKGASEVVVLKGSVEAMPVRSAAEPSPIVMKEKEAKRFTASAVTVVDPQNIKPVIQPATMTRPQNKTGFVHWSFDSAKAAGLHVSESMLGAGKVRGGLKFEGADFGRVTLPKANVKLRTVAFWVNVPADANLSGSAPMIAWKSGPRKKPLLTTEIGWNHNPKDGPLGALRTEYARGYTVGSTSLRDGQWHHIAVVFVTDDDDRVQVHQYVDGRLEQTTIRAARKRIPAGAEESADVTKDTIWLGHHVGLRKTTGNFRGQLDELFVFDRPLLPHEIVGLMTTNKLTTDQIAHTTDH
jgi:hypothetical protein